MQKSSLQKPAIPTFRTAYDGLSDEVSNETGLLCLDKTLTQQQFAEESDINTIVNNFLRSGELPDELSKPQFGDFTGVVDNYHDALNLVIAADDAFAALPAKIRARFDNDPAKYVDFFENPENHAEAIKLGLVDAPAPDISTPALPTSAVGGGDVDSEALPPKSSKTSKKGE
jgi:phage internal scaffolding protein